MEVIYVAGGCLWAVQAYMKQIPGVQTTEAGRANGLSSTLEGDYDGYAECVKTTFDPGVITIEELMNYFFKIINPYSMNQQGDDIGEKYRTGIYSCNERHLDEARLFINGREDEGLIVVEILPLNNYVKSAEEHQDHLEKYPDDYCHIPKELMTFDKNN